MKVALPVWRGRVSPVFDVAGQLMIVEVSDGQPAGRHLEPLGATDIGQRVRRLLDLEVEKVICGAISRSFESLLADNGVEVTAGVCGEVEEVLQAFCENRLQEARFMMPGCCGRRIRRQGHGQGQGHGRGQGRGFGRGRRC